MESKSSSISNLMSLEGGRGPSKIICKIVHVYVCVNVLGKESIAFNRFSKVLGNLVLDSFFDTVAMFS